ncbi:hypothetical protein [uncultured Nocardioides sp.]|uniref:hypothetical protein n=1 Tax=uncultured Nocardioides sp. TaxID=198441 RepID=UPI002635F7AC|nr:hypothetical protein [uncultured Nocardioides sp.]
MSIQIDVTAGLVNSVTALATAAAALIAAWAVISANRTSRKAREHQRLDERHRDCVALLAAFEEIQTLREYRYIEHQSIEDYTAAGQRDANNEALKLARARCSALLRASPEALPITRGVPSSTTPGCRLGVTTRRLSDNSGSHLRWATRRRRRPT